MLGMKKNKQTITMKNKYLHIKQNENGSISITYADNAFVGVVTLNSTEDFKSFCEKNAVSWIESELGNYDDFSKEERHLIADKWRKAKTLKVGRYDYYFNLETKETKETHFKAAVEELAESLGIIKYKLIIE